MWKEYEKFSFLKCESQLSKISTIVFQKSVARAEQL